jgi:hypothetical protein
VARTEHTPRPLDQAVHFRLGHLLPRRKFYHRLARSCAAGIVLVAFSLSLGMSGYHWIAGLPWIDAFLDSAMILSGMGPLAPLRNDDAKLFAGCYAIYCGFALLTTAAVILSPLIHRALHAFHLEDDTLR